MSFLLPEFEGDEIKYGNFSVAKRRWCTSTFDFATLATKHKLNLPYQLMDVLIGKCNSEVAVDGNNNTFELATEAFQSFRLGLYLQGVSPFLVPYVTTASINDYSGINQRDSAIERGAPPEIESQFSSHSHQMEAWPLELTMQCMAIHGAFGINEPQIQNAAKFADRWMEIASGNALLKLVARTSNSSATLATYEQSILHIWTAIEALFKSVSSEVSFRLSLYLAQLCADDYGRKEFHGSAKVAYNTRSKIAHGSSNKVDFADWKQAWDLLLSCISAIADRGRLPSEGELLDELLSARA